VFGATPATAFDGVTVGALNVSVCVPVFEIVIVVECVTPPAAATLAGDRFGAGHVAGGAVTTALGGTTQSFVPGGSMLIALAFVAVQPVVAFVNVTGKSADPSFVPGSPPAVQETVGKDKPAGTMTVNACVPVPVLMICGVTTAM
jgi:hypothetical protein